MFPMVSEPWEFDDAKAIFEGQMEFLGASRRSNCRAESATARCSRFPRSPKPSTCLLPKIDFLSIGTNDLTQFLFAADRADPRLAERYDWLSPAILRFIARVVRNTQGHAVDVAVCGEMGGRSLEALALIGLGMHRSVDYPGSGRTSERQ